MCTQGDPIFLFLAGKVQEQFGVGDVVGCIFFFFFPPYSCCVYQEVTQIGTRWATVL